MAKDKQKKKRLVREDISKVTVAILLVIAIVLSIVSTWVILNRSTILPSNNSGQEESTATAQISIIGSDDKNKDDATASLTINNDGEEE